MDTNEPSFQIPEFTDKSDRNKRQKLNSKPLFKMKIGDLLPLEYNPDSDSFKFKHHDLSLVMCGGKITDIFRDDSFFSFEIDDGSGTISCFHKFKYDRDAVLAIVRELPTSVEFLQTTVASNQSRNANESVFNNTNNNSVVRNFENDTGEAFRAVLTWFQDEIVEKQKSRNIGDLIHVMGHLVHSDCVNKINVIDFSINISENTY